MRCPVCHSRNLEVVGTISDYFTITHRYRVCRDCGATFQTKEQLIEGTIQKNIINNLFDEDKSNDNYCISCPLHKSDCKTNCK